MAKTKIHKEHNLGQRVFLLSLLVKRSIKNKYYRSVIGIMWSVLNPLLNTLVMWLVFSQILGSSDQEGMPYIIYILSGNIMFGLMSEATTSSITCIDVQKGLLLSTPVPMEIFPLSKVFSALASFMFSFISLFALMLIYTFFIGSSDFTIHWQIILVITILPAEVIFSAGIAFFLSTFYVFFRDIQHIYSVITTLWRYVTPVFYSLSRIKSETLSVLIQFNPMYQYLTAFRQMIAGSVPSVTTYLWCYGFAAISLIIGWLFVRLVKNKISSQL